MNKIKLILTAALAFVVLFAQAGNAAAAPLMQDTTPIVAVITGIALNTDANGVTTVLVTVVDDLGATQTVRLSVDTAVTLGLVTLDPLTNEPVVNEAQIGESVELDPTTFIPDETTEEAAVHPISALLAGFFNEDASVIDTYHTDGFGFGVIAQALWMSQNLTGTEDAAGDASLASQILDAKESGDYSAFTEYFEDGSAPANWGQFRKALLNKKENLGAVVSGQADESNTAVQPGQGNGNGHGNDQDKNKDKKKDKKDN